MKIIQRGQIENYRKCEHCGCEMIYEYQDIYWDPLRPAHYYIYCPKCYERIELESTPEIDKMYEKKIKERCRDKTNEINYDE